VRCYAPRQQSHRRSSQGSDSSDSYRPRTPHSESPPGPRDFRHRADTGAHTSGHSLNSHSGSPTGTLSTIPEGGTAGSSGGNGAIGGGSGRRKSRRSSRSSSARHQRHSRPGSISPLSTSPREQSLPARKSSGNSSASLVSKEYGTTSSSKQHPSSSSGDARLMSSDSASPVRVRLSGFDSTQEASSHTTPPSDASIYSGMMSTSSELSKEMLKLQQFTILHSESERTSSGGAAAATSSLTTIGEDGVLESTMPPLPSLGRESVDSSSESSLNKRMFSPRYSSAASSPATTKRATLLRGFGRMHETVEIAYNDDSSSSTSKYLSASQSGSSSSFASRSLSRSTGVPLPHRPRRVVRVPAVARAASNSGSTTGLMRSDEHHRPEDALRRSSVPAIFDARELQRTASRGQLLVNKGARPLEVSSLSSLSHSASSVLSSPLQSARTNEKSAVSSSDSTDEQPLAQRSRSAARFSATPPGAAPPQLRTSTSSPHGLRLLREAPQSQSAPHLTALIAPLNSLSAQVIAGLMPSMDSAGSSGRGSLEFADDDAADEAIDEEINSIVELLVSAHEAARGPSPQLRHRTVSRGDESALSELTIPELNLDGDLQPDFSVQRRMSAAADASVVSVGSESTPQHSSTGLSSTGISIAASAVYHAPLSFTLAETDSISGAASPQRTAVGSSTSSGASSLSESSTRSSSGSSNSNSSSSNSSSSSSSSGRGGSGGSGSDDGEVVRSRPRVGRRRKSSASPRKGQ
jgi:hypothetical protein